MLNPQTGHNDGRVVRISAMNGILNHSHQTTNSVVGGILIVAVLIGCCIGIVQCSRADLDEKRDTAQVPQTVIRGGYTIQVFSTPEEQLRHALVWFPDPHEKKASLEVLIDTFPDARNVCAEAELELAYMALGPDYRIASPAQCQTAIDKYKKILTEFPDLPDICAEANWYVGWILADLLGEPGKAAAYYHEVVEKYPATTLNLKSAVPWVSLVLPQLEQRPQAVYERPKYYWASIALLELVRSSETEADKWSAFIKLYTKYRDSRATSYAIRELLNGAPTLRRKTVAYANRHLNATLFSAPMEKEIRKLLNTFDLPGRQLQHGQNQGAE